MYLIKCALQPTLIIYNTSLKGPETIDYKTDIIFDRS